MIQPKLSNTRQEVLISESCGRVLRYLSQSKDILVSAAVGSGIKYNMIANLIYKLANKSNKILFLTHRLGHLDLASSAYQKFSNDFGICKGRLKNYHHDHGVIFGSVQSVWKNVATLAKINYLILDNAHEISSNKMYLKVIESLRESCPDLSIIGYTNVYATARGIPLWEDKASIFSSCAFKYDIKDSIDNRFLSTLSSKASLNPESIFEMSNDKSMRSKRQNFEKNLPEAIENMIKDGIDRKSWLIFCSNLTNCKLVQKELQAQNITSFLIKGKHTAADRKDILQQFEAGAFRALVTVDVVLAGLEIPNVDMLVMFRPTSSRIVYFNMLFAGACMYEHKQDCLVLDYVNNISRHGPIDDLCVKYMGKNVELENTVEEQPEDYEEDLVEEELVTKPSRGENEIIANEADSTAYLFSHERPFYFAEVIKLEVRVSGEWKFILEFTDNENHLYRQFLTFGNEHNVKHNLVSSAVWQILSGKHSKVPISVKEAEARRNELKPPAYIIFECKDLMPWVEGYFFEKKGNLPDGNAYWVKEIDEPNVTERKELFLSKIKDKISDKIM